MKYETKHYLDALFEGSDHICLGSTPYATALQAVSSLSLEAQHMIGLEYVAINPFVAGTKRLDANVSAFRNILVEFDSGALEAQAELVERAELPYTTVVYSGGKSLHAVLSLLEPCSTRQEYDALVKDLYACVPEADPSTKNPGRFTRLGGATRPSQSGGIEQTIIDVKGKVSRETLGAFFKKHAGAVMASRAEQAKQRQLEREAMANAEANPEAIGDLSLRTKDFLRLGARSGGRNRELFFAACDFINQGYPSHEIHQQLLAPAIKSGLEEFEIARTIESAFQKATFRPRFRG